MATLLSFTCPVCGKPLTQIEYDKALGLWDKKQEHIKHLEDEQKKFKKRNFHSRLKKQNYEIKIKRR